MRRFTWWNAVLFSLYALSDGTWLSGITVMTTLLVVTGSVPPLDRLRRCPPRSTGVVLMSLRGCSLLQEAVDDMGAGGYILGAMPVLPSSAASDSTRRHLCRPLCALSAWPIAASRQLHCELNHLCIVRVVIATVGTTLIDGRTPVGPGALVVSGAGARCSLRG